MMDDLDIEDDDELTMAPQVPHASRMMGTNKDVGWSSRFSAWEHESIHSLENGDDLELQMERERAVSSQKLWHCFQTAACSVAQLYKDRQGGVSVWQPFQNAASSVTSLFKDCTESQKRFTELAFQSGSQRRNKEILAWAKKRKRIIRREDLIAMLSGSSGQSHHHYPYLSHRSTWGSNSPRIRAPTESRGSEASGPMGAPSGRSRSPGEEAVASDGDGDLETFREAFALSVAMGLRGSPTHNSFGAGSGCSSGVRSKQNTGRGLTEHISNSSLSPSGHPNGSLAELNEFITEEFTRHVVESRKRSASSTADVIMDSPTHKRSKML